jgi:lantibiotic modifying enzyme
VGITSCPSRRFTYFDHAGRRKENGTVSLQDRYPILKTHPHFENIFTHKELLLLSSLMHGERTSKFLQDVFGTNSNLMDVHIKNIRR